MSYQFKRDDGEIIEVDFHTMMTAKDGFLELPDGTTARRVHNERTMRKKVERKVCDTAIERVSSIGLGFTEAQLPEFRKLKEEEQFSGIEFVPDPDPEIPWYSVKYDSDATLQRYLKRLGRVDKNGSHRSRVMLSEQDFENARELVERA